MPVRAYYPTKDPGIEYICPNCGDSKYSHNTRNYCSCQGFQIMYPVEYGGTSKQIIRNTLSTIRPFVRKKDVRRT